MRRRATLLLLVVLCFVAPMMAEQPPDFAREGLPFLRKHCLRCHSGKEPKAELSLDVFRNGGTVVKQRKVWNNVRKMIRTGDMPPRERPRPCCVKPHPIR